METKGWNMDGEYVRLNEEEEVLSDSAEAQREAAERNAATRKKEQALFEEVSFAATRSPSLVYRDSQQQRQMSEHAPLEICSSRHLQQQTLAAVPLSPPERSPTKRYVRPAELLGPMAGL
jgi:hypothetical protein